MGDVLLIKEIIDRAKGGTTKPFICLCEDEAKYVVKGKEANRDGLIKELIGAYFGLSIGLPIPEFRIVSIDKMLLKYSPDKDKISFNLGLGSCFASKWINSPRLLRKEETSSIPVEIRCKLLIFDWWIKNMDRRDANTNLLVALDSSLAVIDHNLILDKEFTEEVFFREHVFRKDRALPEVGFPFLIKTQESILKALEGFSTFWRNIPDEWLDEEHEDWATPLGDLNYISVYNELSERALQLVDDKFGRLV